MTDEAARLALRAFLLLPPEVFAQFFEQLHPPVCELEGAGLAVGPEARLHPLVVDQEAVRHLGQPSDGVVVHVEDFVSGGEDGVVAQLERRLAAAD